jgi:nicotinate-nucleotide adenylyltransferase
MRLGVYGGTFDPIHLGHLILAESCREACGLERVWFVVAGSPPHKPGGRTDVQHRLKMVKMAIAGHPAFEVSEIESSGPGPHYSAETLARIRRERPDDDLFFLIGGDSLADLPSWRSPETIVRLASLVVANRPGFEPPAIAVVADALPIHKVAMPPVGIASSEIRRLKGEGKSIRYQVPRAVEAYIDAHGLYRSPAPSLAASEAPG